MEETLRLQLLRALVRDRQALRLIYGEVTAGDFSQPAEQVIAHCSLQFWETYQQPIGELLRDAAQERALQLKLQKEDRSQLKQLLDLVQTQKLQPVAVQALVDRVRELHARSFYARALDDILTRNERNELTVQTFREVVERARTELHSNGLHATDFFTLQDLEKRQKRRAQQNQLQQFPALLIDPLDEKIKIIGRGSLGLIVAPWNSGKSLMLLHIAAAYALQGLNVLYFSLEDPREEMEDRLDAAVTGLPIRRLHELPKKLKKRFQHFQTLVRGRVHMVDCTEGGFTVTQAEKTWDKEKSQGFEADAIVIDYDDEMVCEKVFKGESARRFEFAEIYRRMRQAAVKTDSIWWTAAQATKKAEGRKIVTPDMIAEDISKIRKATFAVSIGTDPENPALKTLYVMRHKMGRSRFAVDIYSNFERGQIYDRERTLKHGPH